ncbi:peptidylprolyl isomerase [Paenibacillus sp. MAH-36]|uniref:peptidylprolyl isomerase n=1 Tax=Paenibacillus violae TaxID=3077234 RepID=A0ABU3RA07_9BACL|nr:hypothetical protein [Paenibacillus sp. PFR10]MDU0200913.1 hypothetical protein [Paenibacillus sp. PFR10]
MKATKRNISVQVSRIFLGLLVLTSCTTSVPADQGETSSQAGRLQSEVRIVATVNGEPLTMEEYGLARRLSTPQTGSQEGRKADELETAIQVKVLQLEGVKQGLLASASFADFHAQLDKENERRAQAAEQKAVIYGPKRFSDQTFYADEFAQLENGLKRMAAQTMDTSEEALQLAYQRDLAAYTIQPTIRLKVWKLPISSEAGSDLKRMQALHKEAVSGAKLEVIVNAAEAAPIQVIDEMITEENKRSLLKYREAVFEQANRLHPGEYSPIFVDQSSYVMVYCDSRLEEGVKAFAKVRDEVYRKLVDQKFQSHWDQLRAAADVQVNAAELGSQATFTER